MRDNVFLNYDGNLRTLSFHHMYRQFLQNKRHLIGHEDERHAYHTAAKLFAAADMTMEAIACYRNSEDYVSMLALISRYIGEHISLTERQAEFLLEHLDLLSPELAAREPMADYLRAHIYVELLRLQEAEELFLALEARLLREGTPEALTLVGDVYAYLGFIHMMRNQPDFDELYEKATKYLPDGTRFKGKKKLRVGNRHSFSMPDCEAGALERMERVVHRGVPWASKILHGGLSGMELIFSAEAAYLTYRFDDARQWAQRAIAQGEEAAQYDVVCNAHCLLARIGWILGDFSEMSREVAAVVDYADLHSHGTVREIRDTLLAWYYIKLDDISKVPRWIHLVNEQETPLTDQGREQIVYANLLIHTGEFSKLVAYLEHPQGLYLTQGIWPDRICLFIMLAIGYYNLDKPEKAVEALWTAYEMSYHNQLTTLFIEAGKYMRTLTEAVRSQDVYRFDPAWLDLINRRSNSFSRRMLTVQGAYRKSCAMEPAQPARLTRREQGILLSLSQGLTREEISDVHTISVNTVKSIITSIYSKLGALNRADAIYIATSNGYIR